MSEPKDALPPRLPRLRSAPKASGQAKKFRIRPGTIRYKVATLLVEGTHTLEEIAALSGAKTAANTSSNIFCLKRDYGVGYERDRDTGHLRALLARGRTAEELLPPDHRKAVLVDNPFW